MKIQGKGHFEIHNAVQGATAEVMIHGVIGGGFFGDGVIAADVIKSVQAMNLKSSDTLRVRINSVGGDYFEGITLYNFFKGLKAKVNIVIDALAASAASLIAISGDTVDMPENTYIMIHAVSTGFWGNAEQFIQEAATLKKLQEGTIINYLERTKDLTKNELIAMLYANNGDGTWFSAQEAVDIGFADNVIAQVQAAACIDPSSLGMRPPEDFVAISKPIVSIADRRAQLENLTAVR